jgi:triphosphoribosyl-dephospho-CoA synthase
VTADDDHPRPGFAPPAHARLALLLEVAGTPKPGNVDREHDAAGLRFEHFLAGAVGAGPGLAAAADPDRPLGVAFERAVAGMSQQAGGNTQFGCLCLLVPLVRTAATGGLTRERARATVEATTVADAEAFLAAFDHVDVALPDPPEGSPDARAGSAAAADAAAAGLTWYDLFARAEGDGNAAEWTGGFERTFGAAAAMLADDGPAPDRVARAFLDLLGGRSDGHVRTTHDAATAREVRDRAAACGGLDDARALAVDLRERGINPGTTADATAAATFVALERGLPV